MKNNKSTSSTVLPVISDGNFGVATVVLTFEVVLQKKKMIIQTANNID